MLTKFRSIIQAQLKRGADPRGLAMSCALAWTVGTFPVLGSTTALGFALGYFFKANQPLLQFLNYLLYPVQLLLIPVFLKMGAVLTHAPAVSLSPDQLMLQFKSNPKLFFLQYGLAGFHAVLAWAIVVPLIGFFIFLLLKPIFVRAAFRFSDKNGLKK